MNHNPSPMSQQDQLRERHVQVQNDDQLSVEARASSVIGPIEITADTIDAASVSGEAATPPPAVARITEDKPAVSEDDAQGSNQQRACDEAALQDVETIDLPQEDAPFETATEQQKDQDDSSSLSELEIQEPAIPCQDRIPEETQPNGSDVDEEGNTRSSSEDAIVQDSQPVYQGRPIGSSSPVDVPYQNDTLEHSNPANQAVGPSAEFEREISQNLATENEVIGEIHDTLAREDASVPSKDLPQKQAVIEDDAYGLPSSSPEANHAEQTDEEALSTLLVPVPTNSTETHAGHKTSKESLVSDQEGSLNEADANGVNENAATVHAQGIQSETMQHESNVEKQSPRHLENEVPDSSRSFDARIDEAQHCQQLECEAAVELYISTHAAAETSELASRCMEMDIEMGTPSLLREEQPEEEQPSKQNDAPRRDNLKSFGSQPTVLKLEMNTNIAATDESQFPTDTSSDCFIGAVDEQNRFPRSDAGLPTSLDFPILKIRSGRESEGAIPQDSMTAVLTEGGKIDPVETDGSGELEEINQSAQDRQDIRDTTAQPGSSDVPVVGSVSQSSEDTAEDVGNTVSTARTTGLAGPSTRGPLAHDTPLKRAAQPVDSSSTPSSVSRLHSTKGQTYVGGMLASNKAMRPFRSPMIARKEGTPVDGFANRGDSAAQSLTPSKPSNGNGIKAPAGRKSMLSSSTMSPGMNASSPSTSSARAPTKILLPSMKTGIAGNVALNKPFKSLFSKSTGEQAIAGDSSAEAAPEMTDINGKPMSIFQLSTSLHKLERRLALLKDAKRHRIARERELDSADNTDHIRELSTKWLEKGREAAELLWELVKDNMETQENNQHGDSGFGGGFGNDTNQYNWGWDTSEEPAKAKSGRLRRQHERTSWQATNTVERLRETVSIAIDELPEDERQALYRETEAEGSLPELDPNMILVKSRRKRSLAGGRDRSSKKARLDSDADAADNNDKQDNTNDEVDSTLDSGSEEPRSQHGEAEDNDALSDTAHEEEEKQPNSPDGEEDEEMDGEEDPNGRGMAKMLMSCGIDTKTFGWDAGKEEWDELNGQT